MGTNSKKIFWGDLVGGKKTHYLVNFTKKFNYDAIFSDNLVLFARLLK